MNKYYHSTLRDAKTKLLVIAITTAAIIAEVTTITMSAATPASAKVNCNAETFASICSDDSGCSRI